MASVSEPEPDNALPTGEGLAVAAGCLSFTLTLAGGMATTAVIAKEALSG